MLTPAQADHIITKATADAADNIENLIGRATNKELTEDEFDKLATAVQDDGIEVAVQRLVTR